MPRPIRCRRIEQLPVYRSFSPDDISSAESVRMTVDEFEALRLLDDEGLTQEACAVRMNIARTTVTAIYDSARKKVADALVHGKRLLITGGCCAFAPVELHQIIMEKGNTKKKGFPNYIIIIAAIAVVCCAIAMYIFIHKKMNKKDLDL